MSTLNLVSLFQMCSQARKRSDLWLHSFPTPNLSTDLDSSVMSKPSPTICITTVWPSSRQPPFWGSLPSRAFHWDPCVPLFHGFLSTEPSGWCFQDLSHSTPLFCCKFPVASHLVWNKSQRWHAGRPHLAPVASDCSITMLPGSLRPGARISVLHAKSPSASRRLRLLTDASKTPPVFSDVVTSLPSCFYSQFSSQISLSLATLPKEHLSLSLPAHQRLPTVPILL